MNLRDGVEMAKHKEPVVSTDLSGVAGEFFVAAELSRKGYLAAFTQKNTKSVDILVSNVQATKSATIQVKTNRGHNRSWMLKKKAESLDASRFFYIFVSLCGIESPPEYHIVPSKIVAEYIKAAHQKWLDTPGKDGRPHQDNDMRHFQVHTDDYLNKWELLELDEPVISGPKATKVRKRK
jgi:hypothetical protein